MITTTTTVKLVRLGYLYIINSTRLTTWLAGVELHI